MGLRGKFAAVFLALLIVPITAATVAQIDRLSRLLVEDLEDSASLLIDQTYEAMRATPIPAGTDPSAAIAHDPALGNLVNSSQAFGKGVVYVRIIDAHGGALVGADAPRGPSNAVAPFADLKRITEGGAPWNRIGGLWDSRTYELRRGVELNGQPFATIAVGVSTSLITPEVHRMVYRVLLGSAEAAGLALLGAALAAGWVLQRLGMITSGVDQIATGNRADALKLRGTDELSRLGAKVNQLSEKIASEKAGWEIERERLLNRFHSIRDGILLLGPDLIVRFVNDEAQGQLGLPAGGVADGRSLAELLGEKHPLVRLVRSAQSAHTGVYDLEIDSQPDCRLVISAFPLGDQSEQGALMMIIRDLMPTDQPIANGAGRNGADAANV